MKTEPRKYWTRAYKTDNEDGFSLSVWLGGKPSDDFIKSDVWLEPLQEHEVKE